MKTMIFWLRKGSRKPKMVGLATANCSVLTISDFSRMAREGKGRLFVVDGPNAAHGRRMIARRELQLLDTYLRFQARANRVPIHRAGDKPDIGAAAMTANLEGGRVVAIGAIACQAIAGAAEGARNWDARLARDGSVKIRDTRAIGGRSDGVTPHPTDYFGR